MTKAFPIQDQKKIVVIGGGSGQPVILRGLKRFEVDLTAIITVADDGGSSGKLRDYLKMVPPGDIRNVMAELSGLDQDFTDIFQYRFKEGDEFLTGHALGNLFIAGVAEKEGGIFPAIQYLSKLMKIKGHVYPVVNEPLELHARFSDGTTMCGEAEITAAHKRIEEVWVTSSNVNAEPRASKEVVDAILDADVVVLGPGSLYTSILPNVVVPNVAAALRATRAKVVYIANIMTQKGETESFSDGDHLRVINDHANTQIVDAVIMNRGIVPEDYIDWKHWNELSYQVASDPDEVSAQGAVPIIGDLLELRDDGAFHDGNVVAELLMQIANNNDVN
ncbi:MAG: YvcK family protein [Lactobacillaceae bacterium]|jgi:uncharacterized cofD-like protein|nr:YvcK family protein [Lactobacillaceae bacterium]